jgi:ABC-type xylose transport system substrate-binding protein
MAKKKEVENVEVDQPLEEVVNKKPRSIITMASDGQTFSTPIKTTRELYMEVVNDEKN